MKRNILISFFLLGFFIHNTFSQTNLLVNGDFENGTTGWVNWGGKMETVSDAHSGKSAVKISNRKNSWDALARDITGLLESGKEYQLTLWIKIPGKSINFRPTLAINANGSTTYQSFFWVAEPKTDTYVLYSGTYTPNWTGKLTNANLYFETDAVNGVFSDYIIDDIVLVENIPDTTGLVFTNNGLKDIKSSMKIGGCVTEGKYYYFTSPKAKSQVLHDCQVATVQCYPGWGRWDEKLRHVYHIETFHDYVKEMKSKKMLVTAHMLLGWDQYFPDWYKNNDFEADTLDAMMQSWIKSIITYKGNDTLVDNWNVVNEAINWDGKGGYWPINADNKNNACELQRIGFEDDASGLPKDMIVNAKHPVYIGKAFKYSRQFTNKKLELRDAGFEFPTNDKYKAFYQLAVHLKKTGIPVDVIGFQTHLDLKNNYDWEGYANNIKRYRDLGYEVYIPEVDIGDTDKDWSDEKAELQKLMYYQLITAAIRGGASELHTWGFTDDNNSGWRSGEQAFPYTNNFEQKPSYFGMKEAFTDMSHILFWEMDLVKDGKMPDVMMYNNSGTLINFNTPVFTNGFKSKALQFDGVDDYITTAKLSDSISGDFTFSCYINTSMSKTCIIANIASENKSGIKLGLNTEGKLVLYAAETGLNTDLVSNSKVNDGQWHFIALRREGLNFQLYVDNSTPVVSGKGTNIKYVKLIVGAKSDGTSPFEGLIDEVKLYDSAIEEASFMRNMSPLPPRDLKLTKSKMVMKLSWIDQSNNEDGFIIERKIKDGNWKEIVLEGTNKQALSDTVTEYSTEYSYRVKAYNKFGTSDYINIKTITSSAAPVIIGINDTGSKKGLNLIYPNPVKDTFTIISCQNSNLKLFDIQGKLLIEKNNLSGLDIVDIKQFTNGIYIVKIFNSIKISTTKLVKE